MSHELRPEALDDLGLVNALIALCSRVAEASGISVHRQLESPRPPLSPETELAIYRVAQEALTNAMRHSQARDVTVSLSHPDDSLVLTVIDNGRGLPEPMIEGGGLAGMRERAMLIGAELEIKSMVGAGVSVMLRLALNEGQL